MNFLRARLRVHLSKDISLLGWPGNKFWWAHLNYRLCYGTEDYQAKKAWSEQRYAGWIKEGWKLSVQRNWQHRLYIEATAPLKNQ